MKKIVIIILVLFSIQNCVIAGKSKKPAKPAMSQGMIDSTTAVLNEFTSHIKPESFGKKWTKGKDEYSKKLAAASKPEDFGKITQMLEKNINDDSYKDSWDAMRSSWNKRAGDVKNVKGLANLFKQLESHLKPPSMDETWAAKREAWVGSLATLK